MAPKAPSYPLDLSVTGRGRIVEVASPQPSVVPALPDTGSEDGWLRCLLITGPSWNDRSEPGTDTNQRSPQFTERPIRPYGSICSSGVRLGDLNESSLA
jgi:hypothetical protein